MSRVLFTGSTTPIGHAAVRALIADPKIEHVLAVGVEPEIRMPRSDKLTYQPCDLTRPREVRNLVFGPARRLAIDTVIHTVLHRSARDEGDRVHAVNVESTRELLRLVEDHPTIARFVFKSFAEVYRISSSVPSVIAEDHPLSLEARTPQWIRDRTEADLTVCARMGMSRISIAVLRCAECLAPQSGSQLFDYLSSAVCLRPLGFDPMLNLLSIADLGGALALAVHSKEQGIFNIPGRDTLPLSRVIELAGRIDVPTPGFVLSPLYRLRRRVFDLLDFRYDMNAARFHFGNVLDGRRAEEKLGYRPAAFIDWNALFVDGRPHADSLPRGDTAPRS